MPKKINYSFIVVNYKVPTDSLKFIESIEVALKNRNYTICIVDNDGSFKNYQKKIKNIIYLETNHNIDYLQGLKLGLNYLKIKKKYSKIDYIFLSNADIIVEKNFFEIFEKFNYFRFSCIAPKIINLNSNYGLKNQNPYLIEKPTIYYFLLMKIIYSNYYLYLFYDYLSFIKFKIRNLSKKIDETEIREIYSPYGSFVGFSPAILNKINLNHNITSGGIEIIFSNELNKINSKAYYIPKLSVQHKNKSSFNTFNKKEIFKRISPSYDYIFQNIILSKNYLIKRLGRSGGIIYEEYLYKKILMKKNFFNSQFLILSKNKLNKIINIILINLKVLFIYKNKNIFYPMGTFFFLSKKNNNFIIFHHKDKLNISINGIISYIFFLLFKLNLKKIKYIICVSQYWYRYLRQMGVEKNKLVLFYNNPEIEKVKEKSIKYLKNKKYIYCGIYEKSDFEFYNKLIKSKMDKIIFVFTTSYNKKIFINQKEILILNLDKAQYKWLLINAQSILIHTNIMEGWSRVVHESVLTNKNVFSNTKGGLKELSKIGNINLSSSYQNFEKNKISSPKKLKKYIESKNSLGIKKIMSVIN